MARFFRILAVLFPALLWSTFASAHPLHSSLAEVEWNPTSGRFEIALRMNSLELESELNLLNPERVNLDQAKQAEPAVKRYIEQRFRIATASHPQCRHHWVGMELERLDLWIYFELEPAGAAMPEKAVLLDSLRIFNSVLMYRNPQQINLVNFTHGSTIRSSHHSNEAPEAVPAEPENDSASRLN